MYKLPDIINNLDELNEVLSRPSDALVEYIKNLDGNIMVLGAGGKIGPTMARMAKRAVDAAGADKKVIAVASSPLEELAAEGIETIAYDLMDWKAVNQLPKIKNIVYMVGRKFGSGGNECLTWATNVMIPHNVADAFRDSRLAVFSTGCVYPVTDINSGGSLETEKPIPVGEYAQSCLGRERIFDYYASEKGEKVIHIRLNYALEVRYGVFVDVASKVFNGEPVDVTTSVANGIWQGDCCDQVLRSFDLATSPSSILNVTGPETFSIRWLANMFGEKFGKEVTFTGQENGKAYLSNATKANSIFGNPSVPLGRVVDWVAHWIQSGHENIGKPTHFETQDGKY